MKHHDLDRRDKTSRLGRLALVALESCLLGNVSCEGPHGRVINPFYRMLFNSMC